MQARNHCERVSLEERSSHTRALIHMLSSWAADNKAMIDIIKLPFSSLEEKVRLRMPACSYFLLGSKLHNLYSPCWSVGGFYFAVSRGLSSVCCYDDVSGALLACMVFCLCCRCCANGWRLRCRLARRWRAFCPCISCSAAVSLRPCRHMPASHRALCQVLLMLCHAV